MATIWERKIKLSLYNTIMIYPNPISKKACFIRWPAASRIASAPKTLGWMERLAEFPVANTMCLFQNPEELVEINFLSYHKNAETILICLVLPQLRIASILVGHGAMAKRVQTVKSLQQWATRRKLPLVAKPKERSFAPSKRPYSSAIHAEKASGSWFQDSNSKSLHPFFSACRIKF